MHQHQQGPFQGMLAVSNLCSFVARTGAITVEVFLHNRFGARYIGGQAAAAVLLIPLWSVLFPHEDARPLLWFLGAYLCLCVWARLAIAWRQWHVDREHSRYNGWPRILPWDWRGERVVKLFIEPLLVYLGGAGLLPYSQPLGFYLMFTSLCLLATNAEFRQWEKQRELDLQDAMYEQETNARIFRDLQRRR